MHDSIYARQFGVEPLINAAGTFSYLGGSLMPDAVISAWCEAARYYVDMHELLDAVGQRLAQLLRVEAVLVTGGAASGLLLATAAAITDRYPSFAQESSVPAGMEVLKPAYHRDLYDRQIETCPVTIVHVDTIEDARRKISDRTVLMMTYNVYEPEGPIRHQAWLDLAKQAGLPTLLDAAADVPPVANLWRYVHMGYDMVAVSGGKAIRGPQGAGLLVGKQSWIHRARINAFPHEGTMGRVAKVSKEDIVALFAAVEAYVQGDDNALASRCTRDLSLIADLVKKLPSVTTRFLTPEVANHVPHLLVEWCETKYGVTPLQVRQALREGKPRIATDRVYGTGEQGLLLSAINLQPGEAKIVASRLIDILSHHDEV